MTFLQKVAKSGCVNKSTSVLNRMMEARRILGYNQRSTFRQSDKSRQMLHHIDLSEQQIEFKRMADELRKDMHKANSAMGLFLKHSPDCIYHLLNECVASW